MTERGFETSFWDDPFVQDLSPDAKLLFIYLKTNAHANQAGLYPLTLRTMSFETGIPQNQLSTILHSLVKKVEWYSEDGFIWVKDFLSEQAKSPKFITSAITYIRSDKVPEDISSDFQEFNQALLQRANVQPQISLSKRECVLIRDNFKCLYCNKDLVSNTDYEMEHIIPKISGGKEHYQNLAASCTSCNKKKGGRTPEDAGMPTPHPSTFHASQALFILKNNQDIQKKWDVFFPGKNVETILNNINQSYSILNQDTPSRTRPSVSASVSLSLSGSGSEDWEKGVDKGEKGVVKLSPADEKIIAVWLKVKDFNLTRVDCIELLSRLKEEYSDVDILKQSKDWAARKLSEPLTAASKVSSQIWHWMAKAREIASRNGESANARSSGNGKKWHAKNERLNYKRCSSCSWKSGEKTGLANCPECGEPLQKDFTGGDLGHIVKQ